MGVGRGVAVVLFWGAVPFLAGCGGSLRRHVRPSPTKHNGVFVERGAMVLTGPALGDGRGSLLDTMRGKVPSFRLRTHPGVCPGISLRGRTSVSGIVSPDVYVDGTRATDTCILEQLRASDVRRVEVYPMGFTTRPGYGMHAEGLILVFMRSGNGV